MSYIIIAEETIHHDGDERSKRYPGHGYPAWDQTLQVATVYTDYKKFYDRVVDLQIEKAKFKVYKGDEMTVTTKIEVEIK